MHYFFMLSLLLTVSVYGSSPSGIPVEKPILADASTGEIDEGDDDSDSGEVDEDIIIDEEEPNDDEGVNN
jgi:hypothetical protein